MSVTQVLSPPKLGPASAGVLMTPEEFDLVDEWDENYRYELIKGVLVVSPLPLEQEADPNELLGYLLRRYRDDHPQGSALDKTLSGAVHPHAGQSPPRRSRDLGRAGPAAGPQGRRSDDRRRVCLRGEAQLQKGLRGKAAGVSRNRGGRILGDRPLPADHVGLQQPARRAAGAGGRRHGNVSNSAASRLRASPGQAPGRRRRVGRTELSRPCVSNGPLIPTASTCGLPSISRLDFSGRNSNDSLRTPTEGGSG